MDIRIFRGVWENDIATPLQPPKEVADRPTLTDAEVEKMRQKAKELFTGKADAVFFDGFYPAVLANVLGLRQGFKSTDGETGDYGSEWTKAWSLMVPLHRSAKPIYEYACHEGNLALAGILAGARADEAAAAKEREPNSRVDAR